ncbi:MAG TPA: hypothetical protein VFX24_04395 [Ktedonobacterales bacterium]|nr:hypothetical protein [Ktedonobacterales bacterium]
MDTTPLADASGRRRHAVPVYQTTGRELRGRYGKRDETIYRSEMFHKGGD